MNDNELNQIINPISLKKQNGFFFKKIKINKIANSYFHNLRNNNNQNRKTNNTLNINQKYLLKNSDLSKISELANTNPKNNILNDAYCTVQTLSNKFKNKKLLNFKKINNINTNIKFKYKQPFFTSLLYKKNSNKNESNSKNVENFENKKNYFNKKRIKISLDEKYNFSIKKNNIKKEINKKRIKDIINKNDSLFSRTLDDNTFNSNYNCTFNSNNTLNTNYNINFNSNSTRKENSERQKQDIFVLQGDSIKSINLIKENNEKILSRLLSNKDNKNININIKYFYKKNIRNINWNFYNTYNNINTQKVIFKNKDRIKKTKKQNRSKKNNNYFQHGKSHNNIKIDNLKKPIICFSSEKVNLIKNIFNYRNNNYLTFNNFSNRSSKSHKFRFNNTSNNIFSNKTHKTINKTNKNFSSNIQSKQTNQKFINNIKNNLKIFNK